GAPPSSSPTGACARGVLAVRCSWRQFMWPRMPSHRLRTDLAPDQHPPYFRRPRPDLVQLGIPPQPPERVLVDVAVAAEHLDALAGHPRRLLGAPQDHRRAVLAHLPHMIAADHVEILAVRVAEGARRLQHG